MRFAFYGLLATILATSSVAAPPDKETVVRPEPAPGPLDNPMKGWCPYTDAGPIGQPYSMVFLYTSWAELEPEEGRYAFDRWEAKAWSVPAAKGKHVVLRVYIDYPSKPSGLPGWLKAKGVKMTPYDDHGGGLSPDYDDPRMITAMTRLIEAMGKRYDTNPQVAFIQLGLLGFWGEWHTWPKAKMYASKPTVEQVIKAYQVAFPHKKLMARNANDFAGKQSWLGFHDDMFPEDTDSGQDWSFLANLRTAGRENNWKVSIIGGEMVPGKARQWLVERSADTLDMVDRSHFSWVGPYCPALVTSKSDEFKKRSEALVRRMGYQYRLKTVQHSSSVAREGTLSIKIEGENEGVAPFYYPWPVELALIDDRGKLVGQFPLPSDLSTWMPGPFLVKESVKVDVNPGRYKLALGIKDPWTDKPAIAFANKLPRQDGWTILSSVVIEPRR